MGHKSINICARGWADGNRNTAKCAQTGIQGHGRARFGCEMCRKVNCREQNGGGNIPALCDNKSFIIFGRSNNCLLWDLKRKQYFTLRGRLRQKGLCSFHRCSTCCLWFLWEWLCQFRLGARLGLTLHCPHPFFLRPCSLWV